MPDLEKDYNPHHSTSPTHLDDASSSNEPVRDPLALPSMVPPLNLSDGEKSPTDQPPPDGGLHAWLQVLGSFFLFFNSW
jgi:hypothetical protein